MGRRGPKATTLKTAAGDFLSAANRGLTVAERQEWNRIVRTKSPGFYREEDVQLLKKYCRTLSLSEFYDQALQAALEAGDAEQADRFSKRYEKSITQILALCRMLKIGPLTRETQRRTEKAGRAGIPEKRSARLGLMYGDAGGAASRPELN